MEEQPYKYDEEEKELTREELNAMEPLDRIKAACERAHIILKDPDPECKKCFGRGYIAVKESGEPIPCDCIYNKDLNFAMNGMAKYSAPRNRAERRRFNKKAGHILNMMVKRGKKNG